MFPFNTYPYDNLTDLNLDWIIATIKKLNKEMDTYTALNTISWGGTWNIGDAYKQWTIVEDSGNGYISIQPVPRNVSISDTNYWVMVADYSALYASFNQRITDLENAVDTINNTTIPSLQTLLQNEIDTATLGIIRPEDYGAVADGVTDCSGAIQDAIDNNPDSTILFTGGTYAIENTITDVRGIHFLIGPESTIKATASMDVMIFNDQITHGGSPNSNRNSFIIGGILDGNMLAKTVYGHANCIGCVVRDVRIQNFKEVGIDTGYVDGVNHTYSGYSNVYSNVYIRNESAGANDLTYGIYHASQDASFYDITTVDCKVGIYLGDGGGNQLYNCHPWLESPYDKFDGSIAYVITAGSNKFTACTNDNMQTAFQLSTGICILMLENSRIVWHIMDAAIVAAAGGFKFLDVTNGADVYVHSNNLYMDTAYNTGGVYLPDSEFYKKNAYYKYVLMNNHFGSNVEAMSGTIRYPDEFYRGVPFQTGDDLNDFLYAGKWYSSNSTMSASLVNAPTGTQFTGAGIVLTVERSFSSAFVIQTVETLYMGSGMNLRAYRVLRNNGQDSGWKTF